jgi:probable HAF family extracellular repeat protein
MRSYPRL